MRKSSSNNSLLALQNQSDVSQTTIPGSMSQEFLPADITPTTSDLAFPSYPSGSPGTSSARTAMCTNLTTGHNAELTFLKQSVPIYERIH